jgi:anti-sigma factor ChrR (cupin superfamily)
MVAQSAGNLFPNHSLTEPEKIPLTEPLQYDSRIGISIMRPTTSPILPRPSMNKHPVKQLHDFFFDRLDAAQRGPVEAHIATCVSCKQRLAAFADAVNKVPPTTPTPALHERLLQSIDHLERFAPFAQRLGELAFMPTNDARRALHSLADVDAWPLEPLPGMRAFPLAYGPPHSPVSAILAHFDSTCSVPLHRHLDRECILVLQGSFETTDGGVIRAGDELHSEQGSVHGIVRFSDDKDCLCAIINPERIDYIELPLAGEAL